MADDIFSKALGYFTPGDSSDPRVNPQLRQRIALALMQRQSKYPKNVGEGLSAIGEAIGDRRLMRSLEEGDLAQQAAAPGIVGGGSPAAAATPGYAPPDDAAASSPAVAAINSAASNTPPIVPAQAPGRGFTPVPMSAGQGEMIEPGEYNAIDAADPRNRYTPAPAYLAPDLNSLIKDPERRGFLGQLAGKEAQSPNEISPTGAAGPFQFTRGTGAQYGIPGNARLDPKASILAADRLTDDNVATLTAKLGREPTPGEMALAHQQGAGTAGNMLTGAGNASASNLAVNNVPPGMGPQAAAQKVMGYYGMPGAGVTTPGPRDAVAAALAAQQQQPQSPQRPSVADYGQRLALAATPQPDAGIQPAPPAPPPIRPAPQPQQQVAQAQPQAIPGFVPPAPGPTRGAPIIQMGPEEARLTRIMMTPEAQNNSYAMTQLQAKLAPLVAERTQRQNEANEQYKAQLLRDTEQAKLNMTGRMDQSKRIADVATTQQEQEKRALEIADAKDKATMQSRFGGRDPEKFFTEFDKQKESAAGAASAMDHYALAQEMLKKGVIAGTGQGWKVDAAKVAAAFGFKSQAEAVARTEQMEAAIKSTLRLAVENIQGAGGKVSDTDVKVASGTIGADPKQQLETIQRLVNEGQKVARLKINDYEEQKDYYLGGTRAERRYDIPMQPTAPAPHLKTLLDNRDSEPHKQEFDARFGTGAADLEIARAKRRDRRGG